MKKITTFTALICLLNTFLCAQNSPIKFGISINPNYSYRYFYSDNTLLKKTFDALESGKISGSVGGFIEKKMSEHSRLHVGINLMNWGSVINKTGLGSWGSQNSNGTFDPNLPTNEPNGFSAIRFTYNSLNIQLPIDFQFFINKKRSFYFNLGISPLYNLGNYTTTTITLGDGRTKKTTSKDNLSDAKKLYFGMNLGFGYEWKINEKCIFEIQPQGQIFILDLANLSGKSGTIPYNLGVQMGLKF
jgi:hypothetical protein